MSLYWEIQTIKLLILYLFLSFYYITCHFFLFVTCNLWDVFVPFSDWIIFSSILCRADLAIFNHFSLSFSWRVFVPPFILTDSFDGHCSLGWQMQTSSDLKVFFSGPCGLKGFCWVTRCWSNRSAFISDLTFLHCSFQNLFFVPCF